MRRVISNGWLFALLPLVACEEPYEIWEGSEWTSQRAFLDDESPEASWLLDARNGAGLQADGAEVETTLDLTLTVGAAADETAQGRRADILFVVEEQTPGGGWNTLAEQRIVVPWGVAGEWSSLQLPVMDNCAPDRACDRTWRVTADSDSGGVVEVQMSVGTIAEGTVPVGWGREPRQTRMDLVVQRQ